MKIPSIASASCLALALIASPATAVMTFGIHGGFDFNGQDALRLSGVELPNGDELSIHREELTGPLMGGAHLFVDITPIIDFEFGLEGSTSTYEVSYDHLPLGEIEANLFSDELRFWRLSAYAHAKYNILELPMTRGYVGGGLGYHFISELISRKLLEKEIVDVGSTDLDPKELIERQGSVGVHLLLGARVSPTGLPVALNFELRYSMLPENDFGDETNRFASAVLAVDFGY